MTKPLLKWDVQDNPKPTELIWCSQLDKRFLIEVRKTKKQYEARLYIFDHNNDDQLLETFDVDANYEEELGPDALDIFEWQTKAEEFIDALYHKERNV